MKSVKQYQCEICNTLYREEKDCKECEKSHVSIVSIEEQIFNSFKNGGIYPKGIECKMSDGSIKFFRIK